MSKKIFEKKLDYKGYTISCKVEIDESSENCTPNKPVVSMSWGNNEWQSGVLSESTQERWILITIEDYIREARDAIDKMLRDKPNIYNKLESWGFTEIK